MGKCQTEGKIRVLIQTAPAICAARTSLSDDAQVALYNLNKWWTFVSVHEDGKEPGDEAENLIFQSKKMAYDVVEGDSGAPCMRPHWLVRLRLGDLRSILTHIDERFLDPNVTTFSLNPGSQLHFLFDRNVTDEKTGRGKGHVGWEPDGLWAGYEPQRAWKLPEIPSLHLASASYDDYPFFDHVCMVSPTGNLEISSPLLDDAVSHLVRKAGGPEGRREVKIVLCNERSLAGGFISISALSVRVRNLDCTSIPDIEELVRELPTLPVDSLIHHVPSSSGTDKLNAAPQGDTYIPTALQGDTMLETLIKANSSLPLIIRAISADKELLSDLLQNPKRGLPFFLPESMTLPLIRGRNKLPSLPVFSEKIWETITVSEILHQCQYRGIGEGTAYPYVNHPLKVAMFIAAYYGDDEDSIQAALLHDVLEDTPSTPIDLTQYKDRKGERLISDSVIRLIGELTDSGYPGNREERHKMKVERLSTQASVRARNIKMADILSNALVILDKKPGDCSFPALWVRESKDILDNIVPYPSYSALEDMAVFSFPLYEFTKKVVDAVGEVVSQNQFLSVWQEVVEDNWWRSRGRETSS